MGQILWRDLVYLEILMPMTHQDDDSMQMAKLFFSTMIVFFLIDMMWLGFIAKNTYSEHIGSLLRKSGDMMTPNWYAAVIVYAILALGVMLFVLTRTNGNYLQAIIWGALFGFVIYGVYDFTNYSILANWSLKITLIDLVWGTFLCSTVSVIATYIQKLLS
jgi:uncharacterized membrane protein